MFIPLQLLIMNIGRYTLEIQRIVAVKAHGRISALIGRAATVHLENGSKLRFNREEAQVLKQEIIVFDQTKQVAGMIKAAQTRL